MKVGLLGASGRTGGAVQHLLKTEYSSVLELVASPGRQDSLDPLLTCDVVIDFSIPAATLTLGELATKKGHRNFAWIIGTTGFTEDDRKRIEIWARNQPILLASNFSLGMMAFSQVVKSAAPLLEKLKFRPALTETHHQHKKDAPSGTALSLQRMISPKEPESVPVRSIREGDVVGIHELVYSGPSERLFFSHEALDRAVFAYGAVEAALWLTPQRAQFKKFVRAGTPLITAETFFSDRFLT